MQIQLSQHHSVFLSAWLFFFCLRAHVFQHYDGLKASKFSSRPVPSEGRQHGYIAMLDELTLEHMTQDCSSLKNQLLRLKTLLQVRPTFVNNYTYAATHTCVQIDTCTDTLMHVQYELSSDRTLWPVYVASPFEYVHINNMQMSPTQRFLFAVVIRPHTVSCL